MIGLTISLLQALDFTAVEVNSNHEDDRLAFLLKCDRDLIDEHFSGLRLLRFQSPLIVSKSGAIGSLITQTKSPYALVGATFPLMLLDQLCSDSLTSASLLVFFDLCSCLLPGFQCFTFDVRDRSAGHHSRPKCNTFQTSTEQLWRLLILAEILGAYRIIHALANRMHGLLCPSLRCTLKHVLPMDQQCSCMTTKNTTVCQCLPEAASKAIPIHLRAQIVRALRQRLHDNLSQNSMPLRMVHVSQSSLMNVPPTALPVSVNTVVDSSSSHEYKQNNDNHDQKDRDLGDVWYNNEGELSMSFARADSPPRPHSPPQQPRPTPVEQQSSRPFVVQAVEHAVREFLAGAVTEQLIKPQQAEEQEQEQRLIVDYENSQGSHDHHQRPPQRARSLSPTLASIGGKMRAVQQHASAVNRPSTSRAVSQPHIRPTSSQLAHRSKLNDHNIIAEQTVHRSTQSSNSSSSNNNSSNRGIRGSTTGMARESGVGSSVRGGEMYDMHGRYQGTRRELSTPPKCISKTRSHSSRGREKVVQQHFGREKAVKDEALIEAARRRAAERSRERCLQVLDSLQTQEAAELTRQRNVQAVLLKASLARWAQVDVSATLKTRTITNSHNNSCRSSNNRNSSNGSSSSREKAELEISGGNDLHSGIASETVALRRSFDDKSRSGSCGRGGRTGSVTKAGDDSVSVRDSTTRKGEDTDGRIEALKRQCAEEARQRAALRVQLHAKQQAEIEQQRRTQEETKKRLQEERQQERRVQLQQRQRHLHQQQQEQQYSYRQHEQSLYYQQQKQQQKQMEWYTDASGLPVSNRDDNRTSSSSAPPVPVRISLDTSMNKKPEMRFPDMAVVAPDIYPSSSSTHTYRFASDTSSDHYQNMPYDPRRDMGTGLIHPVSDIVPVPQRLSVIPPSPTPPSPPLPPPPPLMQHRPMQQRPIQPIQQQQSHPTKCPSVNVNGAISDSITLSEDFLTGATNTSVPTATPMTEVISSTMNTSSSEEKGETLEERKEKDMDILTEVSTVQRLIDEALFKSNWGTA